MVIGIRVGSYFTTLRYHQMAGKDRLEQDNGDLGHIVSTDVVLINGLLACRKDKHEEHSRKEKGPRHLENLHPLF